MTRPWAMVPFKQDLSGQVNGQLTDFVTTFTFKIGSLRVYRNGQMIIKGDENAGFVILTPNSFRVTFTPAQGERLVVIYLRSS
jgi:hypothetical protein